MRTCIGLRGVGDRSLLLNTHLAEFIGSEMGLQDISRTSDGQHRETENSGN